MNTEFKPFRSIIEEADYVVELTITLTTSIYFAPIERDSPLTNQDAIDNAIGCLPSEVINGLKDGFGGEFNPASVKGVAERVD